ncbi:DUF1810 domain-containing protein [Tabrizicola sp. J26]|uniref:DUF1810 domain-containing protein n=1 Tax=Alitabrizicola rongguiensis TaxID=2909234 RepID=UPI001F1F6A31|nr:DUF1810 domain-containing protein [Tabrizicola rongguiensis]MCF1708638.1 DUF1810 domain-containing protein [Tabrizicola rongguiensis]
MAIERFTVAQDRIWPAPLNELRAGRKATHWMWFVFPQLASLGRSATAKFYGIRDLAEAAEYLDHPILGVRLLEATAAILTHKGRTAEDILGLVDAMKLRSCMTLFAALPGAPEAFAAVLKGFYSGQPCELTLAELEAGR